MIFLKNSFLYCKKTFALLLKFFLRQTFLLTYLPFLQRGIDRWKQQQRETYFTSNKNCRNILLVIGNLGLGDCLLLRLPLSLLQAKYPDYQFYLYADNPSAEGLLKQFCHKITFLSWQNSKLKQFHTVYDLMLNELPSVCRLLPIKTTNIRGIGFGYKRLWYDTWLKPKSLLQQGHIIDYWLYLFGISSTEVKNNFVLLEKCFYFKKKSAPSQLIKELVQNKKAKKEKLILFAPFTGYDTKGRVNFSKSWSLKHYLELSKRLYRDYHCKALWIGVQQDLKRLPSEAEQFFYFESLIGKTELADLIFLLKKCDLLFANPTGIFHLATLLKTPTLTFVDEQPHLWKNYLNDHLHTIIPFSSQQKVFTEMIKKCFPNYAD